MPKKLISINKYRGVLSYTNWERKSGFVRIYTNLSIASPVRPRCPFLAFFPLAVSVIMGAKGKLWWSVKALDRLPRADRKGRDMLKPDELQEKLLREAEAIAIKQFAYTMQSLTATPEGRPQFLEPLAKDAPFLSFCSIIRQERIVDELRKSSKRIEWLTVGLIVLTSVLAFLTIVLICFAKVENHAAPVMPPASQPASQP